MLYIVINLAKIVLFASHDKTEAENFSANIPLTAVLIGTQRAIDNVTWPDTIPKEFLIQNGSGEDNP